MIQFTLEVITSFIEVYVYNSLICLIAKKDVSLRFKVVLSSAITAVILYMNSFSYFSVFTLLFSAIMLSILAVIFFRLQFRHTLAFSLFYVLILHIFDSIVVTVLGLINQHNYVNAITAAGIHRTIFLIIDKGLFVLLFLFIRKWMKTKLNFSASKYLLVISIGGLCGALFLTEQMMEQLDLDIMLSWVFLGVAIMLMLVVAYFYLQQQREKDTLKFAEMRNEILEINYKNIKELYDSNSKLFHDFKNHIRVIDMLVNDGEIEQLKDYISKFELRDRQSNDVKWTEDTVVNFILNNKISAAKQMGISTNANIEFPLKTNISSNDMTTILANLFDNAIAACNQTPTECHKYIDITVRRINNMLFIKLENSCYVAPVFKKGKIRTSKKEKNLHGWGLKSVESTVKKYGGSIDYDYIQEKNAFRITLNLSFSELVDL